MSQTAIHTTDLRKSYRKVTALEEVSLDIAPGERVALVGHNGAGKTTLFKLMLGLIAPTSGEISILGARPQGAAGALQRGAVGFLPENVAFEPGMTGRETLAFFARLKDIGRASVEDFLTRVGLEKAADRRVGTYSKGMRQRLGLAQALLGDPELLLLDEPTTGLDPIVRGDFYDIVADLQRRGVTVVISSHVLSELETRTDRTIILHRGRVAANGTLDGIRHAAGIETRIRVRVEEGAVERELQRLNWANGYAVLDAHTLELTCPPERKMEVIRALTTSDLVHDIESLPPSLEQIYRHYTAAHDEGDSS